MAANLDSIEALVAPCVTALGFEIWSVHLLPGSPKILRVLVDSEKGISSDECGKVSRQIASVLDVEEPISGAYLLEVSSPGLDRPLIRLEHFQRYVGKEAQVKLKEAVESLRSFKGRITAVEHDEITLTTANDCVKLKIEMIEKANLVPCFDLNEVNR
jgi:ribosome maturation factor RimP